MIFTKDSGLVKVWTSLVLDGSYTLAEVPTLFNLKQVVTEAINGTTQ